MRAALHPLSMVSERSGFWLARVAAPLCLLALAAGCAGGQTGQPTRGDCDGLSEVSADEPQLDGFAPIDLARAFEGTHVTPLAWFEGDPQDAATQAVLADEIAIGIAYEGGSGWRRCFGQVSVDVTARITTLQSDLDEVAQVRLDGNPDQAFFQLLGSRVNVQGTLYRLSDRVQPVGSLQAQLGDLPGNQAWFPPGMNCIETLPLDSESLQPTSQQALDWLNGLAPEAIAWQSTVYRSSGELETIRPLEVRLTATPQATCNALESASVAVTATITTQGGETFAADGSVTLAHARDESQVDGVSLYLAPRGAIDSRWLLPDAPACSFSDLELRLEAKASTGPAPFTLVSAALAGGCGTMF